MHSATAWLSSTPLGAFIRGSPHTFALIALGVVLLATLYFWPSITAFRRRHPAMGGVIALNIVFGWTMIGWIGALIWSYSAWPSAADRRRRRAQEEGADARRGSAAAVELPRAPTPETALVVGASATQNCPKCGTAFKLGDAFCSRCGVALQPAATP